ncbi:hypothetical protein BDU57DRAFT_530727 [Ampelomyces quisqualis]|uniref:Uncharacterized protein n=1 Tax=Ampelomyces quisqualis TaxID=50730 RepID=A0A6A5QFD0_AMPQU|nr:hypothetical protein BDU57DRAFT_530727 [Ampelomyces quisqualis]
MGHTRKACLQHLQVHQATGTRTVSTGTAKMWQLKWTGIAIMTVSRRIEKVVRFLHVAGVGLLASWRLFQLSPIIHHWSVRGAGQYATPPSTSAWQYAHKRADTCGHAGVRVIDAHGGLQRSGTATSNEFRARCKQQAAPRTKTWLGMLCVFRRVSRSLGDPDRI